MTTNQARQLPTLALTATVKAPLRQTLEFVNYHLNSGVDHIFIFLDDPGDKAFDSLSKYKKVTPILCDKKYRESTSDIFPDLSREILIYRQRINATYALRLCREKRIDWISHIDADELLYPGGLALKKKLKRTPFKVLRYTVLEAIPEETSYESAFLEISHFKRPATLRYPGLIRYPIRSLLLKCAKPFLSRDYFLLNGDYFRSHTKSKCCVRTNLYITDMRIHEPLIKTRHIRPRMPNQFLLHFDSCGFEPWKNRWNFKLHGNDVPESRKRSHIRLKMGELFSQSNDQLLEKAYISSHSFSRRDRKILRLLRLTTDDVTINPATLAPPEDI